MREVRFTRDAKNFSIIGYELKKKRESISRFSAYCGTSVRFNTLAHRSALYLGKLYFVGCKAAS